MLIECPECGRQVSDQAESCPHCGHPHKSFTQKIPPSAQPKRHVGRRGCLIALGILALLGVIGSFLPGGRHSGNASQNYGPSYIERLRGQVPNELTGGITPQQYEAAGAIIRLNGYDCPTVDLMERYVFSEGFTAYCKGGRYEFDLTNNGGKWSVTVP